MAIAKQQVKLNRSELLPKIGVKGSYDYIHGLEISDQDLFDGGSFSVLLNVSVPLFHFGANSNKYVQPKPNWSRRASNRRT